MAKKQTPSTPILQPRTKGRTVQFREGGDTSTALLLRNGANLLAVGAYAEAEVYFQQAINREPGNPEALYGQAQIALRRGDLIPALERLQAAMAGGLVTVPVLVDHAFLLLYMGATQGAERSARQAVAMAPKAPKALNALAVVLGQEGNHAQALELLQEAAALSPTDIDILNNLGAAHAQLGQVEEAKLAYARLLVHHPGHPEGMAALVRLG